MDIEQYILDYSGKEDLILTELERETNLTMLVPRMLSGRIQGKLLEQISKMIKPENILEIGTYTGYSAICLAKGLQDYGHLQTIEINDENKTIIDKYLKKAKIDNKTTLHIGNALNIISKINDEFDLVFIDGDKREYLQYYKAILPKVKKGGFILADNVLWGDKVIDSPTKIDDYTQGILDFNNHVNNDKNVENFILPIRDGIMILRKIE